MQQAEQALLQHREANLTALAAIGPRKRRPLDSTGSVVHNYTLYIFRIFLKKNNFFL
jgi:hypothetical protein